MEQKNSTRNAENLRAGAVLVLIDEHSLRAVRLLADHSVPRLRSPVKVAVQKYMKVVRILDGRIAAVKHKVQPRHAEQLKAG